VAPRSIKTTDIYWGAVPFVAIQVLMVAVVITFPGIVTSHVSAASGAIRGSGVEELRRQLDIPAAPEAPAAGNAPGGESKEDPAASIERMLKQDK
jgi:hypothetical protein